jgi:Zn-dependent peptidase ImmA (M78 family)
MNYREIITIQQERQRLKSSVGWLKKLPISDLVRRGYLRRCQDEESQVAAALQFFGVSSTDAWERLWTAPDVAFRRSPAFVASPGAVAAWLRVGEIKGQEIQCRPFNRALFKSNLDIIRSMTMDDPGDIKKNLVKICKSSGIAVVFVAELPKTHLGGATQWLSPEKALIQLSCRHKSDDHFWFTFFHESGHILLHGKKDVFIEDQNGSNDAQEREADAFASQTLVPPAKMKAFLDEWAGHEATLVRFAKSLGIAAGIVVGHLQHQGVIGYHQFTNLRRFNFDLTD